MTSATNITAAGATVSTPSQTPPPKKALGKDDFLKLFVTRLRYQNPLEPVNDEQFIAQMAQFTSLEQLQNLNSGLGSLLQQEQATSGRIDQFMELQSGYLGLATINQAVALLGKQVTISVGNTSLTGLVDKVVTEQGMPKILVNGQAYNLNQVQEITSKGDQQ